MAGYNRVILLGNLTRDPDLRVTQGGLAICKIGLAVNTKRASKDGTAKEDVCFVDCTAFGRAAETLHKYMRKGSQLLIEGRLNLEQWESSDGQKRSKLAVIIDNMTFVGGKPGGSHDRSRPADPAVTSEADQPQFGSDPEADADIPF